MKALERDDENLNLVPMNLATTLKRNQCHITIWTFSPANQAVIVYKSSTLWRHASTILMIRFQKMSKSVKMFWWKFTVSSYLPLLHPNRGLSFAVYFISKVQSGIIISAYLNLFEISLRQNCHV